MGLMTLRKPLNCIRHFKSRTGKEGKARIACPEAPGKQARPAARRVAAFGPGIPVSSLSSPFCLICSWYFFKILDVCMYGKPVRIEGVEELILACLQWSVVYKCLPSIATSIAFSVCPTCWHRDRRSWCREDGEPWPRGEDHG